MTIYYVSSAGNDSNNGTQTAPRKTIPTTLKAGDKILLEGTFTGLKVPSSGTSGNPIYFGAYGTGATVKGTSGGICFYTNHKDYITIDGLNIDGANLAMYGIAIDGTGITIKNVTEKNATTIGLMGWGDVVKFPLIENSTFNNNGEQGIHLGGDESIKLGPIDAEISNCKANYNGTSTAYHHGIYIKFCLRAKVHDCVCNNNSGDGITTNGCKDNIIEHNECYSQNVGISESGANGTSSGNIIRYNLTHDNYYNMTVGGSITSSLITHNTLVNGTSRGVSYYPNGTQSGVIFKDNLIVQDGSVVNAWGMYPIEMDRVALLSNNTLDYNCYVYINEGMKTGRMFKIRTPASEGTFAQWKALSGSPDSHSINVDPKFVKNYTDFHLKSDSPCIGKASDGTDIGAFQTGVIDPPPPGPTPEEQIKEEFKKMSESLDLLSAQVATTVSVINKALPIVLSFNDKLDAVIAELEAAKIDTIELQKLSNDLKVATQPLADIVAANP